MSHDTPSPCTTSPASPPDSRHSRGNSPYTHGRGSPSPASTRTPGSKKCKRILLKILMSVYLPAGYSRDPGSAPGSPRGRRRPDRSAGRTYPRTCGTQRCFLSSRLPFEGYKRKCRPWSSGSHCKHPDVLAFKVNLWRCRRRQWGVSIR